MKISLLSLSLTVLCIAVEGSYFTANRPTKQRDPLNRRQFFLKFQNVITNSDNSFIPEYGAFSAPTYGFYNFGLCVPKLGGRRNGRVSLYKFTANNGPEKIITLRPKNSAKCFSVILNLNKGDFIYNVVFGNIQNRQEEFVFTGHLLPDPPIAPKRLAPGQASSGPVFPFAEALPQDENDDDDKNDNRRNQRLPFGNLRG